MTSKNTRYVRHILEGLGAVLNAPSHVFCDSDAARLVTIATGTTKRLRHCDVAAFSCQDLVKKGIIKVNRVNSLDNPADLTSKMLALKLAGAHILRIYSYYGPQVTTQAAG